VCLLIAEEAIVAGCGTESLMSGEEELEVAGDGHDGTRHRLIWMDDPSWMLGAVGGRALPENLFNLSRCRIVRTRVPKTYSPDHRCIQVHKLKKLRSWCSSEKSKNSSSNRCVLVLAVIGLRSRVTIRLNHLGLLFVNLKVK
jgi:hypothetical protein